MFIFQPRSRKDFELPELTARRFHCYVQTRVVKHGSPAMNRPSCFFHNHKTMMEISRFSFPLFNDCLYPRKLVFLL